MPESFALRRFDEATPAEIEAALEHSDVVFFERCPIELPSDTELAFLRDELPRRSRLKNVSYHPESDSVPGFDASASVRRRVKAILKNHRAAVSTYLEKNIPNLAPGWTVGTSSFRTIEEQGRDLKPRSSNEIVHIDAGAYGATNGNRILRFFVNLNPDKERVWGTKGSFHGLFEKHGALATAARGKSRRITLDKSFADRCFTGLVSALGKLYPLAAVIDSSPYDRAMRRIHNYMKESPDFRDDLSDYREIRFPPLSAWSVFTDGVSHSVVSGQYSFVTTILIPLKNCRSPELAPYYILAAADGA
jgi:hypothetical protein